MIKYWHEGLNCLYYVYGRTIRDLLTLYATPGWVMNIATSSSIPGEPGGEALPPVGGRISRGSNEAVRGSGGTSACWGIGFCVVALLILAKKSVYSSIYSC